MLNDAAGQLVAWGVMPMGFVVALMETLKLPKQAAGPPASSDDISRRPGHCPSPQEGLAPPPPSPPRSASQPRLHLRRFQRVSQQGEKLPS